MVTDVDNTKEWNLKNVFPFAASVLALGACTEPQSEPIVTGYNGHSVEVYVAGNASFPQEQIAAKAQETCAIAGKEASYQSTTLEWGTDAFREDETHLFICQ